MFLFYFSMGLAIFSTFLYHLIQKFTPQQVNAGLTLMVTYVVSAVICLLIALFDRPTEGFVTALRQLNWASYALGLAITGIEVGFLLAYRAGWRISVGGLVVNIGATLLLIPVGLVFFKDKVSLTNVVGMVVCLIGLILINLEP
jgi:uncharacterized membrane protein